MNHESISVYELRQEIQTLLETENTERIKKLLENVHPADIADISEHLDTDDQKAVFQILDTEIASDVFSEIHEEAQEELIESLEDQQLVGLLGEMPDDEVVDVLDGLDVAQQEQILALFDPEDNLELRHLLKYPEDTAGGRMTSLYMVLNQDQTVREAIKEIRQNSEEIDNIHYVYVIDRVKRLVGLVSLVDLILHRRSTPLKDVMKTNIISVTTDQDQEDVANIAKKYDLPVVPVVDAAGRLVGRITLDDILEVISEEAAEDISRLAGTYEDEIPHGSVYRVAGIRLPWLIIGLVGEVFAGIMMSRFQATLESILTLAFFVPVIIALGGNTGIQSTAIVVRDLATGEMDLRDTLPRVLREMAVGALNGMACGIIIALIAFVWQGNPRLGLIIGIAMLAVVIIASTIGAFVPLVLKKFNIDPAVATGPFVTTSNDVLGIFVYLGLATLFMDWLK